MYSGTFCTVVYFNLVYKLGNTKKKKTKRKSPIQQLVHSSRRGCERVAQLPELSDVP